MSDVFISYSSKDKEWADRICDVLSMNDISYWIAPKCIPVGSNYTSEIPIAIKNCKIFLILITEDSQQSFWVRKELDTAINNKQLIIPLLEPNIQLAPEFAFLLNGIQHYGSDCTTDPTDTILTRIKAEVKNKNTDTVIRDKAIIFCPKCGCQNITYNEKSYEEKIDATIITYKRYAWMFMLPMWTSIAILCAIKFTFGNVTDLKALIAVPGIIITVIAGCIAILQIVIPYKIRQKNLRMNYILKRGTCCRCGHGFKIKVQADNYIKEGKTQI